VAVCREVIGIDLTPEMLRIAERNCRESGRSNLRFQLGDAVRLPFPDVSFDDVVSRFTFHHFDDPAQVRAEMGRSCRTRGTVAFEDVVVSKHLARAAYKNHSERLRDPSHVEAHPVCRFLSRFTARSLDVEDIQVNHIVPSVDGWLRNAAPADRASEVRDLLARDSTEDLNGTRPSFHNGRWVFTHQPAIVVAQRPSVKRDVSSRIHQAGKCDKPDSYLIPRR
jgi:SAM-dependent methyltransferase